MTRNFEIMDSEGTVESGLMDFEDALSRLNELLEEEFDFVGNIRIIEVHHVLA